MDNLEQLKETNAKLTERLNNAAKYFREQKAQIDTLTTENKSNLEELDNLKRELESYLNENSLLNEQVKKLEETIKGYDDEFKAKDTYADDLNKQLDTYELKLQELETKNTEYVNKVSTIEIEKNKEIEKLKSDYTILNDEFLICKNKLDETLIANKEIQEHCDKLKNFENEYNILVNKLHNFINEIGLIKKSSVSNVKKEEMHRMGSHLESKSEIFSL